MCTPLKKSATDPLRSAISEIMSAMSALNMYPEPKPASELSPLEPRYLSYTDKWAEHAMEHLHAAVDALSDEQSAVTAYRTAYFRYCCLHSAPPTDPFRIWLETQCKFEEEA